MRIIRMSELGEQPWRNGGGVTREIASERRGDALAWRLSMADVSSDGLFSSFDGLTRILTVIDGHGMELISAAGFLQADYGIPVRLDGALEVWSRLKNGPLRDVNLFFDSKLYEGDVAVVLDSDTQEIKVTPSQIVAIHCLTGVMGLRNGIQLSKGDTAFPNAGAHHVNFGGGASAIVVTLTSTPTG